MKDVSIVIPTFNRPHSLITAVESVFSSAGTPREVVVVDQSADAEKYAGKLRGMFSDVTYLCVPAPNLPNARNIGIGRSRGDIILFMDDDAVMRPGCVEEHLAAHGSRNVGIVAGRIRQRGGAAWAATAAVTALDPFTGVTTSNFDLDTEGYVDYATGGHFSIRRDVYLKVGPFNRRFRGNALFEDIEFSLRLRKKGFAVWYSSRALVDHWPQKHGGCTNADTRAYLLDRLHNHVLFYLLCIRPLPSRQFLRYIRHICEYICRTNTAGHSPFLFGRCLHAIGSAYADFLATKIGAGTA